VGERKENVPGNVAHAWWSSVVDLHVSFFNLALHSAVCLGESGFLDFCLLALKRQYLFVSDGHIFFR